MSIKQFIIRVLSTKLDKKLIISRIKSAYNLKSDSKLADFLGIPPTTLSSWKARNSIDLDIIHSKCVDINWNYLIKGIGEAFDKKDESAELIHIGSNTTNSEMIIEILMGEIKRMREELDDRNSNEQIPNRS